MLSAKAFAGRFCRLFFWRFRLSGETGGKTMETGSEEKEECPLLFFFACSSFDNSADRCCPRGFRFGLGVGNDIGRRMGPCAGARGGSAIGLRRFGPNWGSDAGGRSGGGLGRGCDIHELGRAGAPRPIGAGTCFSPISIDSICRLCWRSVCRSVFSLHFRVGSFRRRHQSGFV